MSVQLKLSPEPSADVILLDTNVPEPIIWPVAGGKGGTGKSTLTANIGVGLALLGYKVVLVDCDLGGSDLHLFFDQISPERSLSHFLTKEVRSLEEVLLPTPNANLHLVCGGNDLVGMANLSFMAKAKLLRHIRSLDADYILIDLGAGSAYNTIDFFTLSNSGIIVCTPEPHARVDAYGFIKNTVYRMLRQHFKKASQVSDTIADFSRQAGRKSGKVEHLLDSIADLYPGLAQEGRELLREFRPKLLLNRVRNKRHIAEARRFLALVEEYLSIRLDYVGYVRNDDKIMDACDRRRPMLLHAPKSSASMDVFSVLMGGLQVPDRLHRFSAQQYRKLAQVAKSEAKFW
jgi:flagellar biosynthesis protein FlhG